MLLALSYILISSHLTSLKFLNTGIHKSSLGLLWVEGAAKRHLLIRDCFPYWRQREDIPKFELLSKCNFFDLLSNALCLFFFCSCLLIAYFDLWFTRRLCPTLFFSFSGLTGQQIYLFRWYMVLVCLAAVRRHHSWSPKNSHHIFHVLFYSFDPLLACLAQSHKPHLPSKLKKVSSVIAQIFLLL